MQQSLRCTPTSFSAASRRVGLATRTTPVAPRIRAPCAAAARQQTRHRASQLLCRAEPAQKEPASEEPFEGIPPEEDAEVPGTYFDALNPQTKLGKAVRAAVDELNHLNALEMETLKQCDDLLKKLGVKTSILTPPPGAAAPSPAEDDEALAEEEQASK